MDTTTQINDYIAKQPEWQKRNLEEFRILMHAAGVHVEEGWKWEVPIFLVNGKMVAAMSTFKDHTKFNFFNGFALEDKHKIFNSGLESKKHRGIDLFEGDMVDAGKIEDIVKQAVSL